jgi:acetyl-CoA C-acetyltransferase
MEEKNMSGSVIVAGARTAIGRLLGGLSSFSAPELGGIAIKEAVARAGVSPATIDAVVMGNVVQAGVGPNPARQAAVLAGLPLQVPASTINKLCLSGLNAIAYADLLIATGQCDIVVAGGMESMSNAPHMVRGVRRGIKYGTAPFEDALDRDALVDFFDGASMGEATERYSQSAGLEREELDRFAANSHAKAAAATAAGNFAEEIVAVATKNGDFDTDEGIRAKTTFELLSRLPPAFSAQGTFTAGSSSQLSDGACAVVVMSKEKARALGLVWQAEIGSYGTVAGPDPSLLYQPANAIRDALRRDGQLSLDDIDRVEINEAFAGVALASIGELSIDANKVNVNGGAIALGHPVGMSGARLVHSLILELRRMGGARVGVASLCGGGGQGDALILRVES